MADRGPPRKDGKRWSIGPSFFLAASEKKSQKSAKHSGGSKARSAGGSSGKPDGGARRGRPLSTRSGGSGTRTRLGSAGKGSRGGAGSGGARAGPSRNRSGSKGKPTAPALPTPVGAAQIGALDDDDAYTNYPTMLLQLDVAWGSWKDKKTNILYLDKRMDLGPQFERETGLFSSNPVIKGKLNPRSFRVVHPFGRIENGALATQSSVVLLPEGDSSGKQYILHRIKRPKMAGDKDHKRWVPKLLHTFFPRVWVIFHTRKSIYTVSEMMPAFSLRSYLPASGHEGLIRVYAAELLLLLKLVHKHDIVLRDLSPDLLQVTRTGHLRVMDSRFSWSVMEMYGYKHRDVSDVTPYTAPEIVAGKSKAVKSSDLWSLGATVLRLFTGQDVFLDAESESDYAMLLESVYQNPPNGVTFSSEFRGFLDGLLAAKPEARMTVRSALKHPFITQINRAKVNSRVWPLEKLELKQHEPLMIIKTVGETTDYEIVVKEESTCLNLASVNELPDDGELFGIDIDEPRSTIQGVKGPSDATTWDELDAAIELEEELAVQAVTNPRAAAGADVGAASAYTKSVELTFHIVPVIPQRIGDGSHGDGGGGGGGHDDQKSREKSKGKGKGSAEQGRASAGGSKKPQHQRGKSRDKSTLPDSAPVGRGKSSKQPGGSSNQAGNRSTMPRVESATSEMIRRMSDDSKTVMNGGQLFRGRRAANLTWYDFVPVAKIGRGGFGLVYVAYLFKDQSQHLLAVKLVDKERLHTRKRDLAGNRERLVMKALIGRGFVRLLHSFEDSNFIYLVQQLCEGGNLRDAIRRHWRGKGMKTAVARFASMQYLEEIVLALEKVHDRGIVYRDLKPSNILMSYDGHIHLADFGLSRFMPQHDPESATSRPASKNLSDAADNMTFVGTKEYMSPEMLRGRDGVLVYGRSVDAWALGVLAYELFVGRRPFAKSGRDEVLFGNITGQDIDFSPISDAAARSFVRALLQRDPAKRLGSTMRIRDHHFFEVTEWRNVINRRTRPPYVPAVNRNEFKAEFFPTATRK